MIRERKKEREEKNKNKKGTALRGHRCGGCSARVWRACAGLAAAGAGCWAAALLAGPVSLVGSLRFFERTAREKNISKIYIGILYMKKFIKRFAKT